MAEIHHLTYGAVNPVVAFLIAFVGALLGLACTTRARAARNPRRRTRWLVLAAITIGGAALWLMHFTAMFGFDVPDSPVRYSPWLTVASLVVAVVTVGAGLFIVGRGAPTGGRTALGGLLVGAGAVAMHHTAMAAVRVAGRIEYDFVLVAISAVVAAMGAAVAFWLVVAVRGRGAVIGGAFAFGLAVCAMHYIGMAAMRIRLWTPGETRVEGISPSVLIVPITVLAAVTLIGVAFSALQAMTEEEFADDRRPYPVRAVRAIDAPRRTR